MQLPEFPPVCRNWRKIIAALAGVAKPVISRNEVRPNEVLDTVADIRRARDEAGWYPKVSLREGLERTIRAFREGAA